MYYHLGCGARVCVCVCVWVGVWGCVLLVKGALGELGTTVSKCIQLVYFHNSDIYAWMNPKSLEENFGEKKNSFVPSVGAHILHWACEIVALKCVYIRNAWVIVPTQWSEIYSQWTSLLLLTSIMMLSWLRGHNWVYFPLGHSVLLPCIQNFAFLKTWNCF